METDSKKQKLLFGNAVVICKVNIVCVIVTLCFDFSKEEYFTYGTERFFNYSTELMITSLLAVWAMIAAVLVFYLGKKDENLCGLSCWNIISYRLKRGQRRFICAVLFADLCICIMSIVRPCPITLVGMAVILLTALGYSIYTVIVGTRRDVIIWHLKEKLAEEVKNDGADWECSDLKIVAGNLDYSREEDNDLMLEIIDRCFENTKVKEECEEKEYSALWMLYRLLCFIIPKMPDKDLRALFARSLLGRFSDTDIWTVTVFALAELQGQDTAPDILRVAAAIGADKQRFRELILRLIVYELYLESKTNTCFRDIYITAYIEILGGALARKDIEEMLSFYTQLYKSVVSHKGDATGLQPGEDCFGGVTVKRILDMERWGT